MMTHSLQNTETLSLWCSCHDGSLMSLESDFMARTLTIVVDSAFHWEFHKLPLETRYRMIGENVRIAEAFDFEPWLGAIEPPRETPWEEAQVQRQSNYDKGRLVSVDWKAFAADIETDEDYEIMNAELSVIQPIPVLELGVMSYPNSNYRTVRIHAEHFRFYVGEREMSVGDFQQFGEAYWNNYAKRPERQSSDEAVEAQKEKHD